MLSIFEVRPQSKAPKLLLVDDEDHFRDAMKRQLMARGYHAVDAKTSRKAIDILNRYLPEVVIIDQNMPDLGCMQTVKEIKKTRPEIQIIILSAYGSKDADADTTANDVFKRMHKPCGLSELIEGIEAARQARVDVITRYKKAHGKPRGFIGWLIGVHNARPVCLMIGAILFLFIAFSPASDRLQQLLTTPKTGDGGDLIAGYAYYRDMAAGESISDYFHHRDAPGRAARMQALNPAGQEVREAKTIFKAKAMAGILVVAALFWATGAIPVGMSALLVGGLMYVFSILPPDQLAQACLKDVVIFIFGVLVISKAITKTGLDRRMGKFMLRITGSLWKASFLFIPLLALSASLFPKNILVPCLVPVLMMAYAGSARASSSSKDRYVTVMMILMVCFAVNLGGPGSLTSGGRNALMLGILSDYGPAPTFGQWLVYGLPFVPVCALMMGAYFYVVVRRKLQSGKAVWDIAARQQAESPGAITREEYITLAVLILLFISWVSASHRFGLGGPVILSIVVLNICGVLRWRDVNSIHWDVIALYASACAMGTGLAVTGAALWVADGLAGVVPATFKSGAGLAISASIVSGLVTNLLTDGATVAVVGPVMVQMAALSGTDPWMTGLATAFASSFSYMFVIGTPSNAIAYSMAREPETGRPLLRMRDFFIHGSAVLLLSFLLLWVWVILGYWQWLGFKH